MNLKEILLQNKKEARCSNCIYFEMVNDRTPYCNAHDKLILEMHIDVKRLCDDFELREYTKESEDKQ